MKAPFIKKKSWRLIYFLRTWQNTEKWGMVYRYIFYPATRLILWVDILFKGKNYLWIWCLKQEECVWTTRKVLDEVYFMIGGGTRGRLYLIWLCGVCTSVHHSQVTTFSLYHDPSPSTHLFCPWPVPIPSTLCFSTVGSPRKVMKNSLKMSRLRPSTLLLSLWCECDKDMGFIILLLLKLKNKWAYVQAIGSVVY
jgi:hypothetical protein